MHPEEGEPGIRDGIDEAADEPPRAGLQRVVVAAERDHPLAPGVSGHLSDAVGLEAGAGDDVLRKDLAGGRLDGPLSRMAADPGHSRGRTNLAAPISNLVRVGQRDAPEIDDPGRGRPEGPDSGRVRFELANPLGADLFESFDPVRLAPLANRGEGRELALVQSDDELAAVLERDPVIRSEPLERGLALAAELRLPRSGRVVEARVQHSAVVAGLMRPEGRLLFEENETQPRPTLEKAIRRREPQDAPSYDGDVAGRRHVRASAEAAGSGTPRREASSPKDS